MPKRFLNPGPKPPGYSHVVTATPGKMVFISGQGGTDAAGVLPKDFATQCENTFAHLTRCLALGGATWKDVVKINYFLADISKIQELRAIRAKYLNMDEPPAATAVQAVLSGVMLIEIECTAIVS